MASAEREGLPRFVTQQIHYTLEAREAEYELLPISVDQGLGILVWSPIAGGLLSGKHRRNQATPEGTRQLAGWSEPPIRDEEPAVEYRRCAGRDWRSARRLGRAGSARLAARPSGVTSLVIGGRNEAQFKDNIAAAELKLSDDERAQLDKVSKPPVIYPYWHQGFTVHRRFSEADKVIDRTT